MIEAERNYEIYDREMLAVVEALKEWCHFLKGLSELFEVWTDYQYLQFWKIAQNLTRADKRTGPRLSLSTIS